MKQSWSYDWLGNTTASTDDANLFYERSLGTITNTGYRLTSAERSTDGLNASYDAAGYLKQMNITRAGVVPQQYDYEWDEVGRLTRATRHDNGVQAAELTYAYDASDQRVRKSSGDKHSIYVFGSLELRSTQFTESGYTVDHSTEVPYLFGHGVRLARVMYRDPAVYPDEPRKIFLELGDHLGSTSVVMDRSTGELVQRSTAYAYGAAESHYKSPEWGSFREDYRFTGKEDDIEVGLIYFGARYLNPQLGRWISADPLAVHAPGKADLNLYAYVHGRVLSAVDPVGLADKSCTPDSTEAAAARVEEATPKQTVNDPTKATGKAQPKPAPTSSPTVKQGTGELPKNAVLLRYQGKEQWVHQSEYSLAATLAPHWAEGVDAYEVKEPEPDYGKSDAEKHLEAQLQVRNPEAKVGRSLPSNSESSNLVLPAELKKQESLRSQYMGRTPGKDSPTGRAVQAAMMAEGTLRTNPLTGSQEFLSSNGNWYPMKDADMSHRVAAVTWWNQTGRTYGAKSTEVRAWMRDPKNYTLEHYSINRSLGAKMGETYLPPARPVGK